ncbi:MAG: ABC transporter permease subunit [Treponema sp.]|jgi:peptide/nickel transport system permease protein|nr:ABC transporter permease subunit [Treponema sp.]
MLLYAFTVKWKPWHGIKNAMLPCVTLIGVNFGTLLASQFACETIFSWNGIGKFAGDSIRLKGIQVIQGYILVVAVTFIPIMCTS